MYFTLPLSSAPPSNFPYLQILFEYTDTPKACTIAPEYSIYRISTQKPFLQSLNFFLYIFCFLNFSISMKGIPVSLLRMPHLTSIYISPCTSSQPAPSHPASPAYPSPARFGSGCAPDCSPIMIHNTSFPSFVKLEFS